MKIILIASLFIFQCSFCHAADLRGFIKNCAWGTLGGAALGVVSMAISSKPNESWNNVAKGASLGLYAGIAYGIYHSEKTPEPSPALSVAPQFSKQGQMEGLQMTGTVFEF